MDVLRQIIPVLPDGHPKVRPAQQTKIAGQHADNAIALAVEHDRSSYHLGIAAKPALPKPMTQHHHWGAARAVLFGQKITAFGKAHSQHGEQSSAGVAPKYSLRLAFAR